MKSLKAYHRLSELLTETVKKWRLCLSICIVAAVVIVGGANYYLNKKTQVDYSTTASLIVNPNAKSDENSDPQTIQYYMNTFKMALGDNHYLSQMQTDLTKKQQIKAIADFGAGTIIDNPGGTTILTVKVTDQDPQKAVYTANLIAKQAAKDTYSLMKSGSTRIITKSTAAVPNQVVNKKQILVSALLLVIILSILVTFAIVYFAPNIQGKGIIEDNLPDALLAEITDERSIKSITDDTLTILVQKMSTDNLTVLGMADDKINQQFKTAVESNSNAVAYKASTELSTTGVELLNTDGIILVIARDVTSRKQFGNIFNIVEGNLSKKIVAVLFTQSTKK